MSETHNVHVNNVAFRDVLDVGIRPENKWVCARFKRIKGDSDA